MTTPISLSLAQELRAIRNGGNTKMLFKREPEHEERERPWQPDIDRVQQTLQDVLKAISSLSGVELPGASADSHKSSESVPQLDSKTLKDRIRNDLEAFSITTVAELTKQTEEQTRTALDKIENEMGSRVDQAASEFREKLHSRLDSEELTLDVAQQSKERVAELVQAQTDEFARWVWLMCKGTATPIPTQIEKLLEPYVEEASAKLEGVFRQKVQELLDKQEQAAQERFQETLGSYQSQIDSLEHSAQQICERNMDAAARSSVERLNAVSDEAVKDFAGRIQGEAEGSLGRFHARLEEMASASQGSFNQQEEQRAESFRQRLDGLVGEAQEKNVADISNRIAQSAADVVESSVQHLHHQAEDTLQHSREEMKGFLEVQMETARRDIQDLGQSTHRSLVEDAERVADSLRGLDQELAGVRERHIAASQEQLSGAIQESMESLKERIRQIADTQLETIDHLLRESQDKAASQYESRLNEMNEGRFNDLLGRIEQEAGEAGRRVAAEVKSSSESVMKELSAGVDASAGVLREEAARATSHIETSVQDSLENYRQQLVQITDAGFEEHRKSVANSMAELHNRLKQAADLLVSNLES